MLEKIKKLYEEIVTESKNKEVSDETFSKMTMYQQAIYLKEQSYFNGQLSAINKVLDIIRH